MPYVTEKDARRLTRNSAATAAKTLYAFGSFLFILATLLNAGFVAALFMAGTCAAVGAFIFAIASLS